MRRPPDLEKPLGFAGRIRRLIRNRWVLGGLAAMLLLPLLAVAYWALRADRIAAGVVEAISVEQETLLGELALAEVRLRLRLAETGPAVEAVRRVGDMLTRDSRYRYRWFVGERAEVNAIALPGGVVIVFSGLIAAARSPEELAGALAHEVAHTELRHALRASVKDIGLGGLLHLLTGGADTAVGKVAATAGRRMFSREAEAEADREGLRRLLAAGIDPAGMADFLATLAASEAARPQGEPPRSAWLASHPATAERLAGLRREVESMKSAGMAPPGRLPIDWPAVQAGLAGHRSIPAPAGPAEKPL